MEAHSPAGDAPPFQSIVSPAATRRALGVIFFILLMDVIGITILYPVTAFIVQQYSADALMVTMMTTLYAGAQFFAAPLLGKLGDRYGRRPVLLYSVLGSAIGYLMFGFGGALWLLLVSRVIDGFSGGNMSTASAYIADVSRPDDRARNFSLIGIAWGIGLIAGPALGSLTGQISLQAPAFIAAGLSFASLLLAYFFLPESLPPESRENAPIRAVDLNPFVSIGAMWRKPVIGTLLLVLCLFNFAFNGVNSVQTLFLIDKFNADQGQVGLLLVLIGVMVVGVQIFLIQPIIARYGEKGVAIACLIGFGVGSVLVFFAPNFELILLVSVLSSGISAFVFPTMTTLTANRAAPREQGALMGVTTALNSLMTILGPLWAGIVYDAILPGTPYWMGAFIFVLAAFILSRVPVGEQTSV